MFFRYGTTLDYNNDGHHDLLVPSESSEAGWPWNVYEIVRSTEDRTIVRVREVSGFPNVSAFFFKLTANPTSELVFSDLAFPLWGDFDQDAQLDVLLVSRSTGSSGRVLRRGILSDAGTKLVRVTDGLGNHVDVQRGSDMLDVDLSGDCSNRTDEFPGYSPQRCLSTRPLVVTKVEQFSGDEQSQGYSTYSYQNPRTASLMQGFHFLGRTTKRFSGDGGGSTLPISTTHETFGNLDAGFPFAQVYTYPRIVAPLRPASPSTLESKGSTETSTGVLS